jgi:hypothetical protein
VAAARDPRTRGPDVDVDQRYVDVDQRYPWGSWIKVRRVNSTVGKADSAVIIAFNVECLPKQGVSRL